MKCRMCEGELKQAFALAPTPIANNFSDKPNEGELHPLILMECVTCGHVQLSEVLTGLFKDYKYRTPKAYSTHLHATAVLLKQRYPEARMLLEIGSNNGVYTEILHDWFGGTIIGVDPIGTHWASWREPFDLDCAGRLLKRFGAFDLIVANNVFAHIDDLKEVFECIEYLLSERGAVIIEVQDFQSSLDKGIFDTIYHEHLDQHRPGPWKYLLEAHGLKLTSVEHISPHGGSLRITASRDNPTVWEDPPIDWDTYALKVLAVINKMHELPDNICAWGATAKLTTMIHTCSLEGKIKYCVDSTPEKQGKYLPGTDIQIRSEFEKDADIVLLGAWNYEDEFKKQYPRLRGVNPYD